MYIGGTMKIKKLSILILFIYILLLAGCGGSNSPEALWNRYVKAMNSGDIEKVAEIYHAKDSTKYNQFIEDNDESYFSGFSKLKTKSFNKEIDNDKYYNANVNLLIDTVENPLSIYFFKDIETWKFISEVDIYQSGNQPDKNYYNSIIKTGEGYDYKYVYGQTAGQTSDSDYVKIVAPTSNSRNVIIPSEIEGKPVTVIGEFAFFEYNRIFSVTFPKSNLETIVLPDTITSIEKYAFWQATKLKELELPSSLKTVGAYAFASNTGLKKLTINVDDSAMYGDSNASIESRDSMAIVGESTLYVGDSPYYFTNGAPVTWSSNNPDVATITEAGRITAIAPGEVTIETVNTQNSAFTSKATITILPLAQKKVTSSSTFSGFEFDIPTKWHVNDTATLKIKSSAFGATNWSTSDSSIATIDGSGKLTAVSAGQVKITGVSSLNDTLVAEATITIKDASLKNAQYTLLKDNTEYEAIEFTGARNLNVSDYLDLKTEGYQLNDIIWSSSDPTVASVSMYEGEVTALKAGTVVITATLKDDPNIYSSVKLTVSDVDIAITFSKNSLDRLNSLEELYINSINPHSIEFKGELKLPTTTKIYVPEQNYKTYKEVWSDLKDQIYIMPSE